MKKLLQKVSGNIVTLALVVLLTFFPSCNKPEVTPMRIVIAVLVDPSGDYHFPNPDLNFYETLIRHYSGAEITILVYSVHQEFPSAITLQLQSNQAEPYVYAPDADAVRKKICEVKSRNTASAANFLRDVDEQIIKYSFPDSLDGSFVSTNIQAMQYALASPEFKNYEHKIVLLSTNLLDSPMGSSEKHPVKANLLQQLSETATKVFVIGKGEIKIKAIPLDHYNRFTGSLLNI